MVTNEIILASNSPRRKALLELIDIPFKIVGSTVDEDFNIGLKPIDFAEHYAAAKAADIAAKHHNSLIIGADTIVVFNDEIIGKPHDKLNAIEMLQKLSGKTHEVITGVSLQWQRKDIVDTFSTITKVTFNELTDEQIQYYVDNYQPFDKAGGYAIQEWITVGIPKIEGCYYNVMGFPLAEFYRHFMNIINDMEKINI